MADVREAPDARGPAGPEQAAGAPFSLRLERLPVVLLLVVGGTLVALGAGAVASQVLDKPYAFFTRETVEALRGDTCSGVECSFVAALSNLGIVLWLSTAAVCVFTAILLRSVAGSPLRSSPYLYAGLLTAALGLDDMVALHEFTYTALVGERQVFAAYALVLVLFLIAFRRFLARTSLVLLGLALAGFAFSVVMDRALPGHHLFEDGSKLLGIAAWGTYFIGTAYRDVRGRLP